MADYGVRKYDSFTGRFLTPDVLFEKYPAWNPYHYSLNNPISYRDGNGKYKISAVQAFIYPRLNDYLKNTIQEISNNKKIVNALMKYGEFNEGQIEELLTYGKGPTINVTNLKGAFGEFTPNKGSSELRIDKKLIDRLEKAEGIEREALLFLTGVTILHETAHYGDDQDGKDLPGKEGNHFEKEAYGEVILEKNATKIIENYIKNNKEKE